MPLVLMPVAACVVASGGWAGRAMVSAGLIPPDTDPASVFVVVSNVLCSPGVFGLVIVLFMLYEPLGIYGRWRKIKHYFAMFPMYRKATFKRQKSYVKSDRLR